MSTKSEPTIFIIFGGTGDLNSRKIAPALYNLFLDGWLPKQFSIIGTGRTKLDDEKFRDNQHNDINQFSRSGKADVFFWVVFLVFFFFFVFVVSVVVFFFVIGKRKDMF